MDKPTILSIATANPPNKHNQMDIHDEWLLPYIRSHRARAIFAAAQIETRHSVLPNINFLANEPGIKARNDVYMQAARPLAAGAILHALADADLTPSDIDHFMVVSCTGFDDPGLDVLLAKDLGMRPNLRRSALIGMGCQAGLTGLDRALLELAARPDSHVILLTVEFGSLHFQHGKKLDNMVASALFGDGLAATVIGPEMSGRPKIINTMTYSDYDAHDFLGFKVSDKGYEIRLNTKVPKKLQAIVPDVVTEFLSRNNLVKKDIRFWGIHPGGVKIVDLLQKALKLSTEDLRFSREVLKQYGNMSSVTIFFVLNKIIREGQPQPDDVALLLAFGPGLTIELCLLRW